MANTIKAQFKQATVKGGVTNMQFEAVTESKGVFDAIKLSGGIVFLTIESEQQELPIDQQAPTINIYNVNADTGEVVEAEDAPLLPEEVE
ncbi:hypothetical protein [Olsenella sp. HMSC062G07]|uniref:hypothetical protein n=1 Tax=Olsenella sp. HMSC062G07 TaxID=1739330 RepID=UPI0008A4091A|nr:hypothetical protein [Olsenella sp. HMSC062G07]OFK25065.1 hypothetical protein HMPREF2826_00315 [Olsenella sp. HMSC062G07]